MPRKRTAPEKTEEWKLRAYKVKALRESRGFYAVSDLLESDFWKPLKLVRGLGSDSYYQYEAARRISFQDFHLKKIAKLFKISPELLIDPKIDLEAFMEVIKWKWSYVDGSTYSPESGVASTFFKQNGCNAGWFRGSTTVILGSGEAEGGTKERARASWEICTDLCLQNFERGYLFIGCVRKFGGLHSRNYGSKVDIHLNGSPIDNFSLMVIPENHTDYFHRPSPPDLPVFKQIFECETKYTWTVRKSELREKSQIVTVEIDYDSSWDIDYIGILWMEDLV